MIQAATSISGEVICEHDGVMYGNLRGTVIQVMSPGSVQAGAHDCREKGGFLIELENGDCQLWVQADEDLIFLASNAARLRRWFR